MVVGVFTNVCARVATADANGGALLGKNGVSIVDCDFENITCKCVGADGQSCWCAFGVVCCMLYA